MIEFWKTKQPPAPKLEPFIVWMIKRHMPVVLEIDLASFDLAWSEDDFIHHLRRNCIGMVIECNSQVVGYMVYKLNPGSLEILRIAIHPDHRHHGFGTAAIDKLVSKLSYGRRHTLHCLVPESNLAAQLFLRATGLRAVGVERDACGNEDGYRFKFSVME